MEGILKTGEHPEHQAISVAEVQLLPCTLSGNFLRASSSARSGRVGTGAAAPGRRQIFLGRPLKLRKRLPDNPANGKE